MSTVTSAPFDVSPSNTAEAPTSIPTPLPPGIAGSYTETKTHKETESSPNSARNEEQRPLPKLPPNLSRLSPYPVLRLHIQDLSHTATIAFLSLIDSSRLLPNAISHILTHLYPSRTSPIPASRSVTLVLRAMDGVAYTTGLDLDPQHKEIHLNLSYIANSHPDDHALRRHEIIGVVTDEMVHAYQYNAAGTAPGGLVEGIADFVRLRAGLAPPHWKGAKEERGEKWDEGYQRTAYFLDWLEREKGGGTVGRINEALAKKKEYKEEEFWGEVFGKGVTVKSLWGEYNASLDEENEHLDEENVHGEDANVGKKADGNNQGNEEELVVVSRPSSEGPEESEGPAYLV